jgi:hypothetical protein
VPLHHLCLVAKLFRKLSIETIAWLLFRGDMAQVNTLLLLNSANACFDREICHAEKSDCINSLHVNS